MYFCEANYFYLESNLLNYLIAHVMSQIMLFAFKCFAIKFTYSDI